MKKARYVVAFFLVPLLLTSLLLVGDIVNIVPKAEAQEEAKILREEALYAAGSQWGPASHFNPFVPSPTHGTALMYEALFWFNHYTGELNPWLAESYEWIDNYTIRITLRKEARWRDGTPVTAEDVVYTFRTMKKYDMLVNEWEGTESIEAIDNLTVQINLKKDCPNYVHASGYLGSMIVQKKRWSALEAEYADKGGDLTAEVNGDPEKIEASGPYLLVYEDSTRLVYRRNDNWWGNAIWGQPAPKYYYHIIFASNEAGAREFLAGGIDWHSMWIGNPVQKIKEREWATAWNVNDPEGHIYRPTCPLLLVPNLRKPPLNEPWLRRAISYAIDRERMSKIANDGVLSVLHPSYLPVYVPYVKPYIDEELAAQYLVEYNPTKAREILENHATWNEAEGAWYYDYDNDGVEDKIGPFTVDTVDGWNDTMMQAKLIADAMKSIGIPAETNVRDFPVFVSRMKAMVFDFQVQVMTPHAGINSPIYEYEQLFVGTPGYYRNWCDYTQSPHYEEVENLVREMRIVPIGSERSIELCKKIQKIVIPEMPYIPLLNQGDWGTFNTQRWTNWPTMDNPYTGRQHNWDEHNGLFPVLINIKPTGKKEGELPLPVAALVFIAVIAILAGIYVKKRSSL